MIDTTAQLGRIRAALGVAGVLFGLSAGPALAQQNWTAAEWLGSETSTLAPVFLNPVPLIHQSSGPGLTFDLGGSDQQKLQLRLAEPLYFSQSVQTRDAGLTGSQLTIGSTLGWLAGDDLGLSVSAAESSTPSPFQSLGSIQCKNGVLAADSYTASGCYFVDQPDLTTLSVGATYSITDSASAAINLFRQQSGAGSMVRNLSDTGPALPLSSLPGALSAPLPRGMADQPLDYLQSEVTGIDLEFQLGVATNRAGDLSLGLQLTRILDASSEAQYRDGASFQDWSLSEPADSARVSLGWQKGSFSGGVESYYRAPVEFMNRQGLDSVTTFDVHFTWRTPWNAALSVGASNVLNSGTEDGATDSGLPDPFESVYGRIPYVRYQQDL